MRFQWSAVTVAAGVAMVPPMACHGTPHGAMGSYATPWGAVGMPCCAMGGTMDENVKKSRTLRRGLQTGAPWDAE